MIDQYQKVFNVKNNKINFCDQNSYRYHLASLSVFPNEEINYSFYGVQKSQPKLKHSQRLCINYIFL